MACLVCVPKDDAGALLQVLLLQQEVSPELVQQIGIAILFGVHLSLRPNLKFCLEPLYSATVDALHAAVLTSFLCSCSLEHDFGRFPMRHLATASVVTRCDS